MVVGGLYDVADPPPLLPPQSLKRKMFQVLNSCLSFGVVVDVV